MSNPLIKIKVESVNISEQKGTVKTPVEFIELTKNGITNDAHSGPWHRQVSLLGVESVSKFSAEAGRKIEFGEFAENITTSGLELYNTRPLDRFISDNIELEVTQIGKKCHGSGCAIYNEVGNCVMPKEGIFARVIRGGELKAGEEFIYHPKIFLVSVITLSDRAAAGEYEDKSGPAIITLLNNHFSTVKRRVRIKRVIIPDDNEALQQEILRCIEHDDFIFTTGGTGVGPRDITPDVVKPMLDKEIPGIMEMIRVKYGADKPNALLSRGVAGLAGKTFIYTLPGSVKAVNEYLSEIVKTMEHLIYMLNSLDSH